MLPPSPRILMLTAFFIPCSPFPQSSTNYYAPDFLHSCLRSTFPRLSKLNKSKIKLIIFSQNLYLYGSHCLLFWKASPFLHLFSLSNSFQFHNKWATNSSWSCLISERPPVISFHKYLLSSCYVGQSLETNDTKRFKRYKTCFLTSINI